MRRWLKYAATWIGKLEDNREIQSKSGGSTNGCNEKICKFFKKRSYQKWHKQIRDDNRNQLLSRKPLTWYEHVQRKLEGRPPKHVLECQPTGRSRRRRPRLEWQRVIHKLMNDERNLTLEDCENRQRWKLSVGQRRKTYIYSICTYIGTPVLIANEPNIPGLLYNSITNCITPILT